MMSRKFNKREEAMLVFLTLIFCVAMYYLCIYEPTTTSINEAKIQIEDLESNIIIEQAKSLKLVEMREKLEEIGYGEDEVAIEIPDYDNATNVYKELNEALSSVKSYNISAKPLIFDNNMVTRQIQLTFTSDNYTSARAIIYNLYSSKYRSDISSLVIVPSSKGAVTTISDSEVSVALTIDYYEVQAGA